MRNFFLIIILLFISIFVISGCVTGNAVKSNQENSVDDGEIITIPLSDFSNTLKYYSYDANGIEVRYFVVLDINGNPKVALDACDICGGDKGYRQEGTDVVCNNCGRRFAIDELGTKNTGSGCWPGYLPYKVDNDSVTIRVNDIVSAKNMFV